MTTKIQSIDFPGLSKFNRASEGPQNGGKMTGMDVLEFRDINGEDPMPKYGAKENLQFDFSLGLFKLF